MASGFRDALPRGWITPLAIALGKLGLTPNSLTVLGLILSIAAGVVLSLGFMLWGGILVLVAGLFDLMDGTLARHTKKASPFGAILDSTFDRYGEAAALLGLSIYYVSKGQTLEVVLIYLAIVGSLMVSYVKARAEGLGFSCNVGLFTRPERVFILALCLIIGQAQIALWLLAIFANVTAIHRLLHVKSQMDKS